MNTRLSSSMLLFACTAGLAILASCGDGGATRSSPSSVPPPDKAAVVEPAKAETAKEPQSAATPPASEKPAESTAAKPDAKAAGSTAVVTFGKDVQYSMSIPS